VGGGEGAGQKGIESKKKKKVPLIGVAINSWENEGRKKPEKMERENTKQKGGDGEITRYTSEG